MFAKIIDNQIHFGQREVEYEGQTIKHPSDEIFIALGYLPVVFTTQPEAPEGYEYVETWSQENDHIIQGWELVEVPDEPTAEEIVNILTGETE